MTRNKPRRNTFRIIGGSCRGRRVAFDDRPGLRPSPDRVRETVFNWLAADVPGARCLDLFAGSGSLGMEALSRGAAEAWFVDSDSRVVRRLKANLGELDLAGGRVVRADAETFVDSRGPAFDLVFLDPPFGTGQLGRTLEKLAAGPRLAGNALVYLESPADEPVAVPPGWREIRHKRAGRVAFRLLERAPDEPV